MNHVPEFNRDDWRLLQLGDEWARIFRGFERSAFRLETLQSYASPIETEAIEQFRHGHAPPKEWIGEWCSLVSDHVGNGRSMSRVHVVSLPLSEYLRFETECAYVHTSRAGENISFLDRATIPSGYGDLFSEDFWLFDESIVMVQDYGEKGEMLRARLSTEPSVVDRYIRSRDAAQELAIPFRQFYESNTGKLLD